jgi:hypothetical protein
VGDESSIPRPSLGGVADGNRGSCLEVWNGLEGGDVAWPYRTDFERGEGVNGVGVKGVFVSVIRANERDWVVDKAVCRVLSWTDDLRVWGWPAGRAISEDITRCLAGVWRTDGLRGGTDISTSAGARRAERGTNVRTRIRSRRRGRGAVARYIF